MIITGKVVKGVGYGRKIGFPTANIDRKQYSRTKGTKLGIYAGTVKIEGKKGEWKAGIVVGPIDNKGLPKIEAHLINFSGNLYGKKIILTLKKYLRPFKKHKNEADLISAITKDINLIQSFNEK